MGTLTEELRSQLAERKAELLAFLRDHASSANSVPPPIPRRPSKDPASLSFAQERLWLLEQLEPGSAAYNICRASRLTGKLNIAALEASLTEILRRHEILRSQICVIDGRPMQITVSPPKFKLHFTDLRSLTGTTLDDEIRRLIRAEGERRLDFSAGLFLRAVLLQISGDQHILVLTTHHIVSDAWSMGILTRDLWTLYEAFAKGRPSPLEDRPIQYADYAVWQREWLQGEVLEAQLSYWRKQLENLPVLNLPTDHARPAKQSFRGARQPITLPQSLTTAVNELSRREGVTQFMTLLTAFQALLYRYSGQENVVVGSPIANRNRPEVEGLIGFFVNTLVLRTDLSGNPTFRQLISRVRDVCLGAYGHQDLPFEKLVHELHPERDLSRNPLFQVMFVLQNAPRTLPQVSGISLESLEIARSTSPFDLSLFLRERDEKLIGFFEYSTDLFDRLTIKRMIGQFQTLLEGIVANPDQPISTLPLLTEEEKHQLLVEWNDTAAEYPKDSCIHELFEAQVERAPHVVAVLFEGENLTYRELNARANQLGHYLRGLGVGPESLVGICVERSLEMVIGLLGILKAGGAYVPLDPSYPRERLGFMLKDSQCSFLLTQQSIVEDGRWRMDDGNPRCAILDPQMKVVCLDTDWETIAGESEQNLHGETRADNLAYVIYTSGSTGQPKGVAIEHRNTVALLYWAKSVFTNDELSGVLASTSMCFDLSVFELFVPLSWGGKVILAENALQLHSMPDTNDVTLINTVPSVMTELLAMGNLSDSVRTINLAGEPLRSELVKQIHESANAEKVYDLYGPSETTTYSTFTLRTAEGPPTIGRPILNTEIYILDGNLQPVPIGVLGEIYIGGAGVARGYLNRAELTSEQFIANPFSDEGKSRLYRTGDVARYRSDGNIEFLGRTDTQVKLRGYRIELGEVEAVLTKHATVKDCVVALCEHESWTGKKLVGYVAPRKYSALSVTELRSYLKEKLPEYMVPSSLVFLAELPRMANGKVDRNTLPPPHGVTHPFTREFISPRTEIEELIAQTWQEVLKIENIGIFDNFFELGGHSLLATQIVARLQEAFNKNVPLRVLFDAPTIAELAQGLETIRRNGHESSLPPIVPAPREGPVPLTMNQEHLWRINQMIPGTHYFNMPYVYQLTGNLDVDALEKTLKEIVRRHEALRTVFDEVDGQPVQIVKEGSDIELPIVDLRDKTMDESSDQAAALILEERQGPFDLIMGPLIRTKLVRLRDMESLLLVTLHHIIADLWSMQIFRREIAVLYDASVKGMTLPLPGPEIQFADYALWERQLLADGLLSPQLEFWEEQFRRSLSPNEFLDDPKRKIKASLLRSVQPIEYDSNLFARIKQLAKRENCTPFMVITAALVIVLHQLTGQREIRIGTLVANRRQKKTESTFGHVMNTIGLCLSVDPEITFEELLKQTREVTLAASGHQELPFEQLARVLETKQKIPRDSLFRVLLTYNLVPAPLRFAGLTLASFDMSQVNLEEGLAFTAFDIGLKLNESSTKLSGTITFDAHAFNVGMISSMKELLVSAIENIMVAPRQLISPMHEGMAR